MDVKVHFYQSGEPMFSQTAEYALRAMACMARFPERPLTTAEIAQVTMVPPGYLSKVLQQLSKSGLVAAMRGLRGGYRLRRPPEEITILQVVNAVDPIERIHTCPLGLPEHGTRLCRLHRRLDDAIAHVEQALGGTTLGDVVRLPDDDLPLRPGPLVYPAQAEDVSISSS